jgi:hypothetical protein
MTQTIINLGTGGAVLNGRNGSTAGADSNDALFLDWPGDNAGNYLYLSGVGGNLLIVPDEAALDITGDIDIRLSVSLDDWTPASDMALIQKWVATGDQRSYRLDLLTTGRLRLFWSETGAAATIRTADSTVAPTISDGSPLWVRATLDVDNGASGRTIQFFTSSDGASWTQLGATVTQASVTSIYAGTGQVECGSSVAGKFYRAQVFNGIDGTKVLDVDTSVITTGAATSFTALTGQTVTITRSTAGRKAVAVVSPVWLFGTDDFMEVADNALLDFGASDSFTVLAIRRQWATPVNGGYWIGKRDINAPNVGYALLNNASNAIAQVTLDDGPTGVFPTKAYTTTSMETLTITVNRTAQTATVFVDGIAGSSVSTSTLGSLINSSSLRVGAFAVGTAFQDFELIAVAVFRRALSAAEISAITAYYQARLS